MGRPASKVARVRVTGPLAPFAPKVKAKLRESGYTPLTAVNVMRLMAHLSRWLDANALGVAGLTGEQVDRYVAERRAAARTSALSPRSLAPILAVLAEAGAVGRASVVVPAASGQEAGLAGLRRPLPFEPARAGATAAAEVDAGRRLPRWATASGGRGRPR